MGRRPTRLLSLLLLIPVLACGGTSEDGRTGAEAAEGRATKAVRPETDHQREVQAYLDDYAGRYQDLVMVYCFLWLFFAAAGAGPLSLDRRLRRGQEPRGMTGVSGPEHS